MNSLDINIERKKKIFFKISFPSFYLSYIYVCYNYVVINV